MPVKMEQRAKAEAQGIIFRSNQTAIKEGIVKNSEYLK
jgi:hypothetical protein